jgi:[protein-PII] uridylyltransferase
MPPDRGLARLFQHLVQRLGEAMDPKAFFVAKTLEMRQRHTKYENTPYALEPNCKESPGWLRDLQVILWVAKAAGLGRSWDELARKGPGHATGGAPDQGQRSAAEPDPRPAAPAGPPARRPAGVRPADAVAESFGYKAQAPMPAGPDQQPPLPSPNAPPRQRALMRRYYWAAKAVTQLNQILLLNIEERLDSDDEGSDRLPLRPINERFSTRPACWRWPATTCTMQQPHAILETFLLYQTTVGIKGLSARTCARSTTPARS